MFISKEHKEKFILKSCPLKKEVDTSVYDTIISLRFLG